MQSWLESMGSKMRDMVEKLMLHLSSSKSVDGDVSTEGGSIVMKDKSVLGMPKFLGAIGSSETNRLQTKLPKLECPHFDGNDFRGWWLQIEQFFEADETPLVDKVCIV